MEIVEAIKAVFLPLARQPVHISHLQAFIHSLCLQLQKLHAVLSASIKLSNTSCEMKDVLFDDSHG